MGPKYEVALLNGILFQKLFLPTERKKLFLWSRKTFEIRGWRPRICKIFEISRTIYLNSERSEQFLKENNSLTYFWRFLRSNTLEQFKFKLEKIIGIYKLQEMTPRNDFDAASKSFLAPLCSSEMQIFSLTIHAGFWKMS